MEIFAFYLPQYHPIPENDEWWGEGFTEWRNVVAAKPLFPGHYQPRIPADLGYYDLRAREVIEKQIELAATHGIDGFCFYYYNFGGKRLLEKPLNKFMEIATDFKFSLCWANETWSRRWDGSESEVLIRQDHDLDHDKSIINELIPIFKRKNYKKINGCPVFLIYRASLLPHGEALFSHWRRVAAENGFPGLHISVVESFGVNSAKAYFADSSIEFPPHGISVPEKEVPDIDKNFTGKIYSYQDVVQQKSEYRERNELYFPCIMGEWDNSARRKLRGHVFVDFSLELWREWIYSAVKFVSRRSRVDDQLIYINAWNEWAEGTYLEPDQKHGRKLLEEIKKAKLLGIQLQPGLIKRIKGKEKMSKEIDTLVNGLCDRIDIVEQANARLVNQLRSLRENLVYRFDDIPDFLRKAEKSSQASVQIDYLNGLSISKQRIFKNGELFRAIGWTYCKGFRQMPNSSLFLIFQDIKDKSRRVSMGFSGRIARDDVLKASGLEEGEAAWSGFDVTFQVSLSVGTYAVQVLSGTEDGIFFKDGGYFVVSVLE